MNFWPGHIELVIPGFDITTVLQQSTEKLLVKAFDLQQNKSVLLKILLAKSNKSVLYARLKRELELVARFGLNCIIKPTSIIESKDLLVSVMEDYGDRTLEDYSRHYPLNTIEFLRVAREIVLALSQLHQNGVTHNRLYPGNILFDPENNKVKLLDLETASLLSNESAESFNTQSIGVEMPYLAPEQSGRMNRQVDLRSNLYSLGCIFYEMMAGEQVFDSRNLPELVHAHMARSPMPLTQRNAAIPAVINDMVLKLLNKNAEDRYQSIIGLQKDIETCQRSLKQDKKINLFSIAQYDISKELSFPQKLYGRDTEIKLLIDTFEQVKKGDFAVLMLGGYSGIGKSALVNEVRKFIAAEKGYFISGKYDLLGKNIAHSALLGALKQYILFQLSQSEQSRNKFALRLESSLRGQGQLILEVLPELELLIGPQEKMPLLPVAEAQNRFLDVLCRFVNCMSTKNRPLTIFIDDLQWADLPTLNFIIKLSQFRDNQYIYFIGAFRDNEVSPAHPLMLSILEMQKLGISIQQVHLKPLAEKEVNSFIADTLNQAPKDTIELAKVIRDQTGANPFFLKLFVTRLVEDELIHLDINEFRWKWEVNKIKQAGITENVVELLTQNIKRLPYPCQEILKYAACLGHRFDLSSLRIVSGLPSNQIAKLLWMPLSQHMIVPLDEGYKIAENIEDHEFLDGDLNVHYQFAHDRAQVSAYRLLGEKERLAMHHEIAQKLYNALQPHQLDSQLFDITNHFNTAIPLISKMQELRTIRLLNQRSGDKAREATSFSTAQHFFQKAIDLYNDDDWEQEHDDIIGAHLKLAECEYICGEYDAADHLFGLILSKATEKKDIAKVYDIQLRQYAQQGRNKETLERGASILKNYGVSFIAEPSMMQLVPKLLRTKFMLWGRDISEFSKLPPTDREEKAFAIQTLMNISATAYVYNANTMLLLVLRMVELSVKYGNAPESAFGYGLFGFIEGAALGNPKGSKKFADLSVLLCQNIEDPIIRAKVKFLRAFSTQHWFEPISKALPELLDSFKMLDQSGSYTFAAYSLQALMAKRLYLGETLSKYIEDIFTFSQYADRIKENYTQNLLLVLRCYASRLSGIDLEQMEKHDLLVNEERYLQSLSERRLLMPVAWHFVYNQMFYYQLGDIANARKYANRAKIVDDAAPTTMAQIEHHFYNVLILSESYPTLSLGRKALASIQIRSELSKLKKWTRGCAENFGLRFEIASAQWISTSNSNSQDAAFSKVYTLAESGSNVQLQALTLELWAKHLFNQGEIGKGFAKLVHSIKKYRNWGADKKAEQLEHIYLESAGTLPNGKHEGHPLDDLIDVQSILKASQVISGEIVLEKLLSNLLSILMENAGAQRGFLLLNRDTLRIEAEYNLELDEPIVLQSEPTRGSDKISTMIVNYVLRTSNHVLLDDAQSPNKFSADQYLENNKVRSVLSIPIINQGKTSAIIYLENNLSSNVFTEPRLKMVSTLASQAAISIENALLYNSLEQKVQDRTVELVNAKKKTDELLLNILPHEIAEELKERGEASSKVYKHATIMFTDFRNFTKIVEHMHPEELVNLLDLYFTQFDQIIEKYGLEKIKTVGDAYIAAGGLPDPTKGDPVSVIKAAIEMQRFTKQIEIDRKGKSLPFFDARIGIHTGAVVAGVVGRLKFAYDIWGDTVNIAARLEQNGEAGKINISGSTFKAIEQLYKCTYRGKIAAKNKGEIDMYFVDF